MAVFDDVHYLLSSSIPAEQRKELSGLLDLNGATSAPPHTHLIALAGSHTQHEHVGSLHVVSEVWVQRSIVLGKLQFEQYYSPDPTMIFSGIVACATDISPSDLEVLSAGITSLGGQWRTGLTRDVTHLFALHEQSEKYQTAMHFAPLTRMSILTPHWFDDSVRYGRRVPEGPYLWPDPKILRPGELISTGEDEGEIGTNGKRKRKRTGETGMNSPATKEEGERRECVKVWAGKRLLLSRSLELGEGRREAVEANIRRAGGIVVKGTSADKEVQEEEEATLVDECDVLVTRYRSGKAYFKAARSSRPILIGNLSWMFHVDASGTLSDPHDSLLWYPVPRGGIAGFNDCEITVTNYTGAARDYLKKLIQVMGGKFTPSMSQSNKVLVAGYSPSPKTQRAVAWSIPIVNHTWLEDCFLAWKNLTVGVDKYILFPSGVDFGKMLMTPIGGTNTSSVCVTSGTPVPGGRGIGLIDVDAEEQRDAEYLMEMADEIKVASSTMAPKPNSKAKTASAKSTVVVELKDGRPAKSLGYGESSKGNTRTAPQVTDMSERDAMDVEEVVDFGYDEGARPDDADDMAVDATINQESSAEDEALPKVKTKANGKSVLHPRPSTSKEKAETRKTRLPSPSHESSDSESMPPRPSRSIPGTSTPVKTGMKAKPKRKETPQRAISLSDDDEIFARPVKDHSSPSKAKATVKAKEPEKEPLATSSKAKEKRSIRAQSPTRSVPCSPSPPVKMIKTPKRTLSVLVPSLPKDYLSPNLCKDTTANEKGKSELARTNSIHVSAAEASTSGSKRGRPFLSKPSTSTPPVKDKSKSRVQDESGPEHAEEFSTSRSFSKRSAANKATSKLREVIMPDVVNFEKERKNAKRRRSSGLNDSFIPLHDEEEVEQKRESKKRKVDGSREEDKEEESEVEEVVSSSIPTKLKVGTTRGKGPKKRAEHEMSVEEDEPSKGKGAKTSQTKKGSHVHNVDTDQPSESPQQTGAVRVMTTGVQLSDDNIKRLIKLGARMTTRPNDCTHLVAKGIVRTEKFMCAIASSPFILTEGWVNSSIQAGKLLPEKGFLISDSQSERKWKFKLSASLERAKRDDGGAGLLKGMTFYVTPKVDIDVKLLKAVVASAGGQIQTSKPTVRILNANENRHVVSCPADQSIWRPLVEAGYSIYSTELILLAILTQEIRWKDNSCIVAKP